LSAPHRCVRRWPIGRTISQNPPFLIFIAASPDRASARRCCGQALLE
jgi:hypothetical protein